MLTYLEGDLAVKAYHVVTKYLVSTFLFKLVLFIYLIYSRCFDHPKRDRLCPHFILPLIVSRLLVILTVVSSVLSSALYQKWRNNRRPAKSALNTGSVSDNL